MSKIPELSDQFMAAADIEAETPITIGLNGIEHVQPSDWAVIGARLERCGSFSSTDIPDGFCRAHVESVLGARHTAEGRSHLEALTAALDAAEVAK